MARTAATSPKPSHPVDTDKRTGGLFRPYKPEQGRMARMFAFWAVALVLLFGCTSLHTTLVASFAWAGDSVGRVPILAIELNGAFFVAAALFLAGVFVLHWYTQKPKVADLLIDTEGELRKVTWPSGQEVIDSSMVVIVCVLVIMGFLAGADWFLNRVFRYLLLGG